jgi:hypothetical protein
MFIGGLLLWDRKRTHRRPEARFEALAAERV